LKDSGDTKAKLLLKDYLAGKDIKYE